MTGLSDGSSGTITIGGAYLAPPIESLRVAWECPRCRVVNAPHVDQCACVPWSQPIFVPFWYPAEPNASPAIDPPWRVTFSDGVATYHCF